MTNDRSSQGGGALLTLDSVLTIREGECWGVVGGNGSGKSSLAMALTRDGSFRDAQRVSSLEKVLCVSFEDELSLLEREIYEDDSEFLDRVDQGRTTRELVTELMDDSVDMEAIISMMQLERFIDTGFRILSTGERRRMMIARALAQAPDMLVLDEPFDGLDVDFTRHLDELIAGLSGKMPVVLIVNRLSQLGGQITHLAGLSQGELIIAGSRDEVEKSPLWKQFQSTHVDVASLPGLPPGFEPYVPDAERPVVEMRDVKVGYHQKPIIDGLDWVIMPGENWKVSGPNGCGKSTLVNLVSGDHPQCYANEIYLFGKQRGQGESIWDIKRHMGLMSTALHQQYRVTVTVETVVLSGFFDSIGVYRQAKPWQRDLAAEWLEFLGMSAMKGELFQRLSFGQQRMLLIARALVKRPHLLILDEPCIGLDPANRALVVGLVERICANDLAQLLYISHEPEDHIACLTHELKFEEIKPRPNSGPAYRIVKGPVLS